MKLKIKKHHNMVTHQKLSPPMDETITSSFSYQQQPKAYREEHEPGQGHTNLSHNQYI